MGFNHAPPFWIKTKIFSAKPRSQKVENKVKRGRNKAFYSPGSQYGRRVIKADSFGPVVLASCNKSILIIYSGQITGWLSYDCRETISGLKLRST